MNGLSFECFPPRSDTGRRSMKDTIRRLSRLSPDYVSITFGAGGSDREGTLAALRDCVDLGVPTVAHLCHAGLARDEVLALADQFGDLGVRRIVALRGDGHDLREDGFASTSAFVAALIDRGFEVAVACYPEVHPLAASPEADLEVLRGKVEAGAREAVAQFFFDNAMFLDFADRARRAGIEVPIVPGLLPIYDIDKAVELGRNCGSEVPEWVRRRFARADDSRTRGRVGRELVETQAHELGRAGVDHLHVYALNRAELSEVAAEAWREGLRERRRAGIREAA